MDYDDEGQNLAIHIKKGEQVLNGEQAEGVVRFRHNNNGTSYPVEYGDNDLGRMKTQREFIKAVIEQTVKIENIFKIKQWLNILEENVKTNLDFETVKDYIPYAVEFNTDDMLTENALSIVKEVFETHPEVDLVYGNMLRYVNSLEDGYEVKPCTDLERMRFTFLLNHPAIFVRKRAYDKFGLFDLDYKCAMDYELISKMYFGGANFLYIDKPLAAFREGGVSDVKFTQTMKEHKKIAKRNGASTTEIASYIGKLYLRRYALKIVKLLNIEKVLRKHIKKQDYNN
jgi:hypothetical protein